MFPHAADPHAIISCAVTPVVGEAEVWVPLPVGSIRAEAVALVPEWDAFWASTDPQGIFRSAPGIGRTRVSGPPGIVASHGVQAASAPDGQVELIEPDATVPLPAGTEAVLKVRLYTGGPFDVEDPTWVPAVRLPLEVTDLGWGLPILIDTSRTSRLEVAVLSVGQLMALSGFDPQAALGRFNTEGAGPSVEVVTPLLIPDVRVAFNSEWTEGFAGLYERRAEEQRSEGDAVALVHYAGPLADSDTWPIPARMGTSDRATRFELRGSWQGQLDFQTTSPFWYRSTWVELESEDAPAEPAELNLDDDMVFAMGAEAPRELTSGFLRVAIEGRQADLLACSPSTGQADGEIFLLVDPGGQSLLVLAAFENQVVANCLTDVLRDFPFPAATGPPIMVQFPLTLLASE